MAKFYILSKAFNTVSAQTENKTFTLKLIIDLIIISVQVILQFKCNMMMFGVPKGSNVGPLSV